MLEFMRPDNVLEQTRVAQRGRQVAWGCVKLTMGFGGTE